jgi:aminoglycoside phosphotransferase family enzyme
LVISPSDLSLGGAGPIVDWLVVMRRLDDHWVLEQVLREGRLGTAQLDRLVTTLVRFYRRARPAFVSPGAHLAEWRKDLTVNRRILLDARFSLPSGLIRKVDRIQRRFVAECGDMLATRVRRRRIVDGHGDLRPEHVWLDHEVRIIDCLEFNTRLRTVDPLDEIAFLTLECERLGAAWAGRYIRRGVERALHEDLPAVLFLFYRSYRATLRARLAIAHLFETRPRTPEKWPLLARTYLNIAARDAAELEALLRTRRGR